jgi:hypothetical protein
MCGRGDRRFQLLAESFSVMRGLDPRIHPFKKMMDCRVKPGNDVSS